MGAAAGKQLQKYINFQPSSAMQMAAAVISPQLYFKIAAPAIAQAFRKPGPEIAQGETLQKLINVYKGENPFVLEMMDFLLTHLHDDLIGAYVHGSLGTYDEIAYSDFDALVILKDEVVTDPARLTKAASLLHRSRHIMQRYDPLQHHGWFVLVEGDLKNYPQTYFPHELFDEAKSLLLDRGLTIKLDIDERSYDYKIPIRNLAGSIIKKIERQDFPKTMYALKGFTSQFMLLPALYVQAKTGKGIYKRESFPEAKKDFSDEEWLVMDMVSQLRVDWHYDMNEKERKEMISLHPLKARNKKQSGPRIPADIAERLNPEFYASMKSFCHLMLNKTV